MFIALIHRQKQYLNSPQFIILIIKYKIFSFDKRRIQTAFYQTVLHIYRLTSGAVSPVFDYACVSGQTPCLKSYSFFSSLLTDTMDRIFFLKVCFYAIRLKSFELVEIQLGKGAIITGFRNN